MPFTPGGMPHHSSTPSRLPINEPESGGGKYSIEERREALSRVLTNTADSIVNGPQRAILSEWGATIDVQDATFSPDAPPPQDPFHAAVPTTVKWIKIKGDDGVENALGLMFGASNIQYGGRGFMHLYTLQLCTKRGQAVWIVDRIEDATSFFDEATKNPTHALKGDYWTINWRLRMALVLSFLLERAGADRCDPDGGGSYALRDANSREICKWEEHSANYCWARYGRATLSSTEYNLNTVQDVIAFGRTLHTATAKPPTTSVNAALLRTIERLACVLESNGAPTETQEQLVDGIMKDIIKRQYLSGPDDAHARRRNDKRRKGLNKDGINALLTRVKAQIKRTTKGIPSRKTKLQEKKQALEIEGNTQARKTLLTEIALAEVRVEEAETLLKILGDEQWTLDKLLTKAKPEKAVTIKPAK